MKDPNKIDSKFIPRDYQQCSISLMDNISDPNIKFDEKGICNYYYQYLEQERKFVFKGDDGVRKINELVRKIKASGDGKKYDCITGVSGGVDSTYLAYWAKTQGLRPLIVHFDNGWNSEIAVRNVENIISNLGFDLYTLVVNWEEFKDLQLAYLKASVVDIEALTDHAIIGTLYKLAAENGIKYILSGNNIVTEATLPSYWVWDKWDHVNIKDIHKKFGNISLKTFPFFTTKQKQYYIKVKGIETAFVLNYLPYNKKNIKEIISREVGWRDYGGKHYESVWTRFYQGYILPVKFGIDKRKAHLSNLIFSGQISKQEALEEIRQPIYNQEQLKTDYEFVLKKFNLSEEEFDKLMLLQREEHNHFKTERGLTERFPVLGKLKKVFNI